MMKVVIAALRRHIPVDFTLTQEAINCHHNYVEKENDFGRNLWVTRKGAIRARLGDLGIIPGSMGQRSFIVRGKGEPQSYCSCSHGAGRRMSRTKLGIPSPWKIWFSRPKGLSVARTRWFWMKSHPPIRTLMK